MENGNGTFTWADGYKYTGAFIDGLKTGYGEYYYKNGDNYKGMFKAGKFHGKGEYSWSNGAKYIGQSCNEDLRRFWRSAVQTVYYGSGTCINHPLH